MKARFLIFSVIIIFFVNTTAFAQTATPLDSLIAKRIDALLKNHETDPQVSVTEVNTVPRWNGKTLVNGTLYDNGNVGIHTTSPQASLHVMGNDETLILEEQAANSLGTGTLLLLRGHTASQQNSEGRIGLVPDDRNFPYRSGAIEIRPPGRTNFYKNFDVTNPSNLAMTIVNSGIGMGTTSPDASAALDISSVSQGLLIPRMSCRQRLAITNPANGLLVYQTDASRGIYYRDDTAWKAVGSNAPAALQAGNGLRIAGDSIFNTAPDVPITLTGEGNTTVTGTYPNFTISSTGGSGANYTAGSGISLANNTITNTAPDQQVTIETGGTIAAGGTYPNFYLTSPAVTIDAGTGIKVSGAFPHFTIAVTGKVASIQSANNEDEMSSLKQQVTKQQFEIDELKAMVASFTSAATGSLSNKAVVSLSNASLAQNIPNPLHGATTINYTLPAVYASAKLMVTDKSGKPIKEISLSGKGSGSISFEASVLAPGTYQYSLLIDGKLVDTKQMVVIK